MSHRVSARADKNEMPSAPLHGGEIRAAASTYAIFLGIWLIPTLIGVGVAVRQGQWNFPGLWIGLAGMAGSVVFFSRYRITWTEDEIRYRSTLASRTVQFRKIADYEIRGPGWPNRFGPTLGLHLRMRDGSEAIVINLKPFSRSDTSMFVKVIAAKTLGRPVQETKPTL